MNYRTGDILCYGAGKRPAFSVLTRIFAPEDKKFRISHIRNAFNRVYCVHVNQIVEVNRAYVKDTHIRLRMVPVEEYLAENRRRDRTLLGAFRLPIYDWPQVCRALRDTTSAEMARGEWRKRWYDVGGIMADFVPGIGNLVRNNTHRKYCSERVRDDVQADTLTACRLTGLMFTRPPEGICSPQTLMEWAQEHGQWIR